MDVSVIIPVYNARGLAAECVASIFAAHSRLDFEIIVVDNGSTPDVEEWLRSEQRLQPTLRYLHYAEPLGFGRAVNRGAAVSSGDVIIALNSDTLVSPGWMEGLYGALLADESLGAITPLTNSTGDAAQLDVRTTDLTAAKALRLIAAKPNPPGIIPVAHRLTFFCVAVRRSVWTELGGLDESYEIGNFEDDDFCMRLRVAGYRLGVARDVFVYHYTSATFQANRVSHADSMRRNAAIFAAHARAFAGMFPAPTPRVPRTSAEDISVVILPNPGGALERTLISLDNQTVAGFELVSRSGAAATRTWIAYLSAGDICYPFHLEALKEALDRTGSVAVFSDPWVANPPGHVPHPDALRIVRGLGPGEPPRPRVLAGWMHHASLDPERLWEQTIPAHLIRMTWETCPALSATPDAADTLIDATPTPPSLTRVALESVRGFYRRAVPYETRLDVDRRVRGLLRFRSGATRDAQLKERVHPLTGDLRHVEGMDEASGRFTVSTSRPAVFLFNIVAWQSLVQRPHHFARGLAERGHTVFWIEIRLHPPGHWRLSRRLPEVAPGVHLLRLPGTGSEIYHQIWEPGSAQMMCDALEQVASAYGIREAVSLVNYPRWEPVATKAKDTFGWNIVYDCLDDQRAFANMFQTRLDDHERLLIDTASLVTVSAALLREDLHSRRDALLLPNGADFELFSSPAPLHPLALLRRPIVGFFGALADWLDIDLILAAARRFPEWSFVYIGWPTFSSPAGAERWSHAATLPNVHVLPQMAPVTLAAYLADFDVCTMPFLDIPVTRVMNAVKLYEYLAAGKHVVSRDLPEVRRMISGAGTGMPGTGDLIALYSTKEEFYAQLESAVSARHDGSAPARQRFARQNDWSFRVDRLSEEIVRVAGVDAHDTRSRIASSNG